MSNTWREGVDHYIGLSVKFALLDGERGHDDGCYLNARIAANYGFQLLPEDREPRTWIAPDAMQFRGSRGQNLRCEHGTWSGWRCIGCTPAPKVPDEAFAYLRDLSRLAESLSGILPVSRRGIGPHREDYATQEAYDKARGEPVATPSESPSPDPPASS